MKKILIFIIILCLFGCKSEEELNNNDNSIIEDMIVDKYIEPINEVNYFDELNDDIKSDLLGVYGDSEVPNNILEMYGKEFKAVSLSDYYGNTFDFNDYLNIDFVLEISQRICNHCKKQVPLTEEILNNDDVMFIQYFANTDKTGVDEFYEESKHEIPSKLKVLVENKEMSDVISEIGVNSTPTFLFVHNNKITLACSGELSYAHYLNAKKFAFDSLIDVKSLTNSEGASVFSLSRNYDDVLNDLSTTNKDKMALVENCEEVTVRNIGKYVEFFTVYELGEKAPLYNLNFKQYVNKPLVVFYLGNINDNLDDDIRVINEFYSKYQDINMVTILMDNDDFETSLPYSKLENQLLTDVVSSGGEIVKDILDAKVITYPACIFIQDNTIVGGLNSFKNLGTLDLAYNIFMGDDSIALKENN